MLDLLSLGNTECIEHGDKSLRTEESHEIIFERDIELGLTGISLTSGTSAELVIDTP